MCCIIENVPKRTVSNNLIPAYHSAIPQCLSDQVSNYAYCFRSVLPLIMVAPYLPYEILYL